MPTPTSTEAVHALALEPHADGTYDPAAHELSIACAVTLSIFSYQLTTTRERIDERGAKQGVIETHKLNRFEEIVRGLVAGGAPFLLRGSGITPRTARKYLQLALDAGAEVAGVVWNYERQLGIGDKITERIFRIVFRPRAAGEVAA